MDVVAFAGGMVVARRAWDGSSYGFGNRLLVAHQFGDFALWSLYAHLVGFDDSVQEGHVVVAGQRLGACGKSGLQEWAHTHFEALTAWRRARRLPLSALQRLV